MIYPDLACTAMREKRDRELRLWTLARAFDAKGGGQIDRREFAEWLETLDLRGLSPQSVRALLARGEGVFWHTNSQRDCFYLIGLLSLCCALGVSFLSKQRTTVSLDKLRTLKSWRSACFASYFAGDRFSKPISRRTLRKLCGRSAPTQCAYAKATKIEAQQNAAPTHKEVGREREDGEFVALVDSEPTVLRRLPNSYRSHVETAGYGNQGRKVGKTLRHAWKNGAGQCASSLYLEGPKRTAKTCRRIESAVVSGQDDEFYTRQWLTGSTMLWTAYVVCGGLVMTL